MFDTDKLKFLFFDIGNVFVSDDPSGCFVYQALFDRLVSEGRQLSAEEFFRLRLEHILEGGSLWSFVGRYISEEEFKDWQRDVRRRMYSQWSRLSPQIDSMVEILPLLSPHYRLGIIANQPAEVEAVLDERGVLKYFELLAISDKLQLFKPDPALYQWAIDAAAVQPCEAMMIGDRLDNDIRPAKHVGMPTAWLRLGYEGRRWSPETDFEYLYAKGALQIAASEWDPTSPEEEPDIIAYNAGELLEALLPSAGIAE